MLVYRGMFMGEIGRGCWTSRIRTNKHHWSEIVGICLYGGRPYFTNNQQG